MNEERKVNMSSLPEEQEREKKASAIISFFEKSPSEPECQRQTRGKTRKEERRID
jgi:hypothetical protein